MLRTAVVAFTVLGALALSGCGAGGSADPDPAATGSGASDEPGAGDGASGDAATDCLASGPWVLDTTAYLAQATSFLESTGVPISELELSGTQTLQFTDDGLVALSTDTTYVGTMAIADMEISLTSHRTDEGSGEWAFTDEDASAILFENWEWISQSTDATATVNGTAVDVPIPDFPTLDPAVTGDVSVTCDATELTLKAATAPLTARFVKP